MYQEALPYEDRLPRTSHNSGYTLRPAGLAFGTFGYAERRIPANVIGKGWAWAGRKTNKPE